MEWGQVHVPGALPVARSAPLGRAHSCYSTAGVTGGETLGSLLSLSWAVLVVDEVYKYRGTSLSSAFLKSLHSMWAAVSFDVPLERKSFPAFPVYFHSPSLLMSPLHVVKLHL